MDCESNGIGTLPYIEVPLFQSGLVYLCQTPDQWEKAHEELGATATMIQRRGAANTFRSLTGGKDIHLLGVFDGTAATLAHEAAHIVFDVCHSVGINVEPGMANETFCYLLDTLVEFGAAYMKADPSQ